MPFIILFGVPKHQRTTKFIDALKQRVYAMDELHIKEADVSITFMPEDGFSANEIIIWVTGLFEKPERTEEVRNRLADRLYQCAQSNFREAMVECFIFPFDQKFGFASALTQKK